VELMNKQIDIYGAGSLLARPIMQALSDNGLSGRCYGRTPPATDALPSSFSWHAQVFDERRDIEAPCAPVVVSCMPIWLFARCLPRLHAARRIIAFSSTSAQSKACGSDPVERKLAADLQSGEEAVACHCRDHAIPWTIFRPTLIYDGVRDGNVTAVARFILRYGFFPVAHPGDGLRQPVHVTDLASAVLAATENEASADKIYNLGGAETLTYRAMVERIFRALGRPVRILPVPPRLAGAGLHALNAIRPTPYRPALFQRMNQNLAFDIAPAHNDLQYRPRPFTPDFRPLLQSLEVGA
jgi:nucleoside-diphosphate-sugar epimerase